MHFKTEKSASRNSKTVARRIAVGLACGASLFVAAVGIVPAAIVAKTVSRPGLYVGKTSQGDAVRLKVVECGTKQCLETSGEAYFSVELSCPSSGQTEEQIIDLSQSAISRSGLVHGVVGSSPGATEGQSSEVFKVARDGTLTGRIRLRETLETGTRCDSGEVTLKAKIGGNAK